MSESPAPIKRKRPVSRWSVGTLTIIQIVLLTILLVAANYLGASYPVKKDLTRTSDYTISPVTERLLQSELIRNRTNPVRMTILFRRSSPFKERLLVLAEEYKRLSNGKIILESIDPVRDADRTNKIATSYGLTVDRDLVIVDARDSVPPAPAEGETNIDATHIRFIDSEQMTVFETDDKKQRRPVAFQGEDALTSALLRALEGKARKLYLLDDRSSLAFDSEQATGTHLTKMLRSRNFELIRVRMADLEEIPADAAGIVLIAPKYDLEPREVKILEEYWQRPKAAFFIALDPGFQPQRLRIFLRANGLSPRKDRILTRRGALTETTVRTSFTAGFEPLKDLWSQASVFEGSSSSLEIRQNDDSQSRRVVALSLIEAATDYWGETKFQEPNPSFDPREDNPPPLTLAAAVIRGAANDDRYAEETARMVVLSNTDFLSPSRMRPEQADFLHSMFTWIGGRQELAGIGPRSLFNYKLPLLDAQVSFINKVNLFFLPALALLLATLVWHNRRA